MTYEQEKDKNPLIKRIPKEIIGDWKKYLVVFLFLVLTIGFVSGMYVANDSMLTSADEGVSKYKQEDGHFELKDKADSELVTAIESGEVKKQLLTKKKTAIAAKLLSRSTRISIATRMRTTTQTAKRTELSVYTQRPGISTLHVSSRALFHKMRTKSLWTECMQTTWA